MKGSTASTLSEFESKQLLAGYGVLALPEQLASSAEAAVAAAEELGAPVVVKLCGAAIAHKTERGLVRLDLRDPREIREAADAMLRAATPDDGDVAVLVAPYVKGSRELIAGIHRDPHFGPCVMVGIGGVLAEVLDDVSLRLVPIDAADAEDMLEELTASALLGPFRGEPPVDRAALVDLLVGLSRLAEDRPDVVAVDVNPLVVVDGRPIAVDALVEIDGVISTDQWQALFQPKGVIVAGASSHPGKFGFVALHNILRHDYAGSVFVTNRDGGQILGVEARTSIADLPDSAADLVFVCTPAAANVSLLRECAAKGVRAAFVTSAGYGEAGDEGRVAERELVALAEELGLLLVGPNGQGVISTPANLCAQIVAPYPPRGRIAIASQSGNFVSSFENYAVQTGIGVSRAVSAGNAAAVSVPDFLEYYATDPESAVSLAYVEGVRDGRAFYERVREVTRRKPLVVLKGGVTSGGQRAAASHTGALASDDRIFEGMCRQAGVTRATTVEEAFEAAATFATQPLPRGPRVAVLTTAGGWGVVTADAVARAGLTLLALPDDLLHAIDEKLPPRWSRNNPVDLAGAETRDTIPEVLELIARHDHVDAVVYLGLGIQSNQARMMRTGRFYPDHGLERIVAYHERQDGRFARAAAEISEATGKPILTATELAIADPDNAGPRTVRETGKVCYPSSHRAVVALAHLWRYARHRRRADGG